MALTKVGKEGITGISNSSDAIAITIDSSERVGIGTLRQQGIWFCNRLVVRQQTYLYEQVILQAVQ